MIRGLDRFRSPADRTNRSPCLHVRAALSPPRLQRAEDLRRPKTIPGKRGSRRRIVNRRRRKVAITGSQDRDRVFNAWFRCVHRKNSAASGSMNESQRTIRGDQRSGSRNSRALRARGLHKAGFHREKMNEDNRLETTGSGCLLFCLAVYRVRLFVWDPDSNLLKDAGQPSRWPFWPNASPSMMFKDPLKTQLCWLVQA